VDCVYSLSHGEGFNMPILEAAAAGKISVTPSIGGHLDFANENNSIFVNSSFGRADRKSMYWSSKYDSEWVIPDINDAALKLKEAQLTYEKRNAILATDAKNIHEKYNWNVIAKQILSYCS